MLIGDRARGANSPVSQVLEGRVHLKDFSWQGGCKVVVDLNQSGAGGFCRQGQTRGGLYESGRAHDQEQFALLG